MDRNQRIDRIVERTGEENTRAANSVRKKHCWYNLAEIPRQLYIVGAGFHTARCWVNHGCAVWKLAPTRCIPICAVVY